MKKTFSILTLFLLFFHSLFSQSLSNLISTNAIDTSTIKNIDIDLTYESISFSPIYGDEIVVDLYANNNLMLPVIDIDEGRGLLTIKTSTKGYNATVGDICKIAVYIPRDVFFDNINITLVSSTFTIDEVKAKDISIIDRGNKEGRIDIINSNFSSLSILSNSSVLNLEKVKAEYIKCFTKDSNIALKNISSDYFDINTKTGFISVSLSTIPLATSNITTISGNIELFVPNATRSNNIGFTLEVYSNKGELNDKINKKKLQPRLGYTRDINNGGAIILLSSERGNIEVSEY